MIPPRQIIPLIAGAMRTAVEASEGWLTNPTGPIETASSIGSAAGSDTGGAA
jgi:hypothetical protein